MAETYYALTDIIKLIDNLVAAMPTSFYNGIMAVRGGLVTAPAADVVARDCYDRLLSESDELRKERPVRHGKWEFIESAPWYHKCNQCQCFLQIDDITDGKANYCPNCGALMDKDGDENDG